MGRWARRMHYPGAALFGWSLSGTLSTDRYTLVIGGVLLLISMACHIEDLAR
jgi:hypothetical protein